MEYLYSNLCFRFIASAVPEVDWRALVVVFVFGSILRFGGSARPDERRLIFSTRKFNTDATLGKILTFCKE